MSETRAIEFVGIAGGIIISSSLLPQVYKTYTTKSAKDISYYYQIIYIVGCTLTNSYAFAEGLWPIYIPCLFEEALIITLTCMKFAYSREDQDERTTRAEDGASDEPTTTAALALTEP